MARSKFSWIASIALASTLLPCSTANAQNGPTDDWLELSTSDIKPKAQHPFISSDGSCVAYQADGEGSGASKRILIFNRLSGKTRQLPFDSSSKVILIGLSPNCSQIVLQDEREDDGQVYYLNTKNPIGLPQRTTILPGAKDVPRLVLSDDGNVVFYKNPLGDGLLWQRLAPGADLPIRIVKYPGVSSAPELLSENGDLLAFTTTAKIYGGSPEVPGNTGHNGGRNTVIASLQDGQVSEYPANRVHINAEQCDDIFPVGFTSDATVLVAVRPQRCHMCEPPKGKLCHGGAGQPFPSASYISPTLGATKRAFYVEGKTSISPDEEQPSFLAVVPGTEDFIVAFRSITAGNCVRIVENGVAKPECLAKFSYSNMLGAAVISRNGRWMALLVDGDLRVVELPSH